MRRRRRWRRAARGPLHRRLQARAQPRPRAGGWGSRPPLPPIRRSLITMSRRIRRVLGDGKGPWLFAGAIAVALLVTPFAIAQTGSDNGKNLRGGARTPSETQTRNFTRETEIIANVPTYGTRQSNKSATGGGAIYG